MRSLFLFIHRFRVFLLFLLLEVTAIGVYINSHDHSRAQTNFQLNKLSFEVYAMRHEVFKYFDLGTENTLLREENALLRSAIYSRESDLRISSNGSYEIISAEIIMMTTRRQRNYFTIDKGSLAGVEPEMGIVGSRGILGKVISTTKHYALCKSILHKDLQISVSLEDSLYFGSMSWNGKNIHQMQLTDIPNYAKVEIGESVYTNAFSTIFPSGIEVAKVMSIAPAEGGTNYFMIELELISDLNRSGAVYVVRDRHLAERDELEQEIEGEE